MATVFAGVLGGAVYILNRRRFLGVGGSVIFSAFVEAFHMLLVLLISDPYLEAVMVVEEVGLPIIVSNSIGMFIFAFMISNLIKERETEEERNL